MSWESIIEKVAPTIATGLGGPLAGMVTKFVADKFLGKPDASQQEVQQAIENATPAQIIQLKQLETDFKKFMADNDLKLETLQAQDTASARDMAVKVGIKTQQVITAIVLIGFIGLVVSLLNGWATIPDKGPVKDAIMILLGLIIREVPTVIQFWMGTSLGSKTKESALVGKNDAS